MEKVCDYQTTNPAEKLIEKQKGYDLPEEC
jgi:hypothetical protein